MRGRRVDWLTSAALPTGLALMEYGWLAPWSVLLGHWLRPGGLQPLLPGVTIVLLLLLGGAAMRAAPGTGLPPPAARALLVGGGLLAALAAVWAEYEAAAAHADPGWLLRLGRAIALLLTEPSPAPLALAFGLALWGRGLTAGRGPLDVGEIADRFRLGLGALVAALLVLAATTPAARPELLASAGPAALAFIPLALATRSLARLAEVRMQMSARSDVAPPPDGDWLGLLLGVVGGLFLLTLLLAQLFAVDLLARLVTGALRLVGAIVGLVLSVVMLPVALLLGALIPWLQGFFGMRPPPAQAAREPARAEDLTDLMERLDLPPEWLLVVQLLIVGLLIVFGLRALVRLIAWRRRPEPVGEAREERDSLWSWTLLAAALRAWLAELRGRFGRQPEEAAAPEPVASAPAPAEPPPVLTLRAIYRRLLGLGVMAGVARGAGATPFEHAPRLAARLGAAEDVAWLTRAYVAARYGPEPPPPALLEEAGLRLRRIAERPAEAHEGRAEE